GQTVVRSTRRAPPHGGSAAAASPPGLLGRSRSATVTRSTRGCLPAGAHMLPAFGGYLSPTLAAASFTALVSAAAALRALVPAAFTDDRVVLVLRRTRVLAALVREMAVRVASAAWRVGRERRTPVTRVSPRRTS